MHAEGAIIDGSIKLILEWQLKEDAYQKPNQTTNKVNWQFSSKLDIIPTCAIYNLGLQLDILFISYINFLGNLFYYVQLSG